MQEGKEVDLDRSRAAPPTASTTRQLSWSVRLDHFIYLLGINGVCQCNSDCIFGVPRPSKLEL